MASSGIYQIRNQANGKRYIGSAVNVGRRCEDHLRRLRRGQHKNRHLQSAFNKQGDRAFAFSLVESVEDSSQLICREQHYLDTLKPEYNLSPTARSNLGIRYTEESCRRMSKAQKGRTFSEESRKKMSQAHKGMRASKETRTRMSMVHKGIRFSKEQRRNMSTAQKARRRKERFR